MTFKDYAALLISCVALAVSGTTAFYTIFSERIELGVAVADDVPITGYEAFGALTSFSFDTKLVLINSGNRPVAVTRVTLRLYQLPKDAETAGGCEEGSRRPLRSATLRPKDPLPPFVVKPADVHVTPLAFERQFDGAVNQVDDSTGDLPEWVRKMQADAAGRFKPDEGDPNYTINLLTCLEARLAAPGEGFVDARWPVAWNHYEVDGPVTFTAGGQRSFSDDRIIPLITGRRTVF